MRSSLFSRKLFLAHAVLLAVAILGSLTFYAVRQDEVIYEQAWHRIREAAWLAEEDVQSSLAKPEDQSLQAKVRHWSEGTGIRYTVVDAQGKVLADSQQESAADVAKMENHLSRKEFVQALREGFGQSSRRSPTVGTTYLYFVEIIDRGGKHIGFVRTALPVAALQEQLAAVQRFTIGVGVATIAMGLVLVYWLTKRLAEPVDSLAQAAVDIANGNYARRVPVDSTGAVGVLARAIEQMKSELGSRETQLRESVQRHSTVLGGMVEGVIAVDADQHVLFANVAAGTNLGFAPDRVEGVPLLEVVRNHELREIVHQSLESSQPVRGEIAWRLRKSMLTFDVQATPLAGKPTPGVVLVMHDVTELKRLEGLRQQFVANVSHELKTPLSSIKAYTETLLNGALEDSTHARHFLTRIDEQASRLHGLILDLLSLARIESGQAALEITSLPLKNIVAKCLRNHEERAKASELTIENQANDTPIAVRADEEALQQILGNLIDNAIKYTPAGGAITIRCKEDGAQVLIEVADTGVGIAREHHSRLFERFYRVDKARSRELGGTGLGLAIVKHLCHAMHGSVSVDSAPGRGSVFGVRLPLAGGTVVQD